MNPKNLALLTMAAVATLLSGPARAQQTQGSSSSASSANNTKHEAKEKHWSGSLVDVGCMAKALGTDNGATGTQASPAPGVPNFAGDPVAQAGGQGPAGGPQGGMPAGGQRTPAQGTTPTQTGTANGVSPEEQAQMARANRVDQASKQCAATEATNQFALAMSGGQVMQFDSEGNSKAKEALKGANPESGKKVKAKVTGVSMIENNNEVLKVASVDVKGKGKHGSAGAGSGS